MMHDYALRFSDFFNDWNRGWTGVGCRRCWSSQQCGICIIMSIMSRLSWKHDLSLVTRSAWVAGKYCPTDRANHGNRKSWRGMYNFIEQEKMKPSPKA